MVAIEKRTEKPGQPFKKNIINKGKLDFIEVKVLGKVKHDNCFQSSKSHKLTKIPYFLK